VATVAVIILPLSLPRAPLPLPVLYPVLTLPLSVTQHSPHPGLGHLTLGPLISFHENTWADMPQTTSHATHGTQATTQSWDTRFGPLLNRPRRHLPFLAFTLPLPLDSSPFPHIETIWHCPLSHPYSFSFDYTYAYLRILTAGE